jgi:hypothetical protein
MSNIDKIREKINDIKHDPLSHRVIISNTVRGPSVSSFLGPDDDARDWYRAGLRRKRRNSLTYFDLFAIQRNAWGEQQRSNNFVTL